MSNKLLSLWQLLAIVCLIPSGLKVVEFENRQLKAIQAFLFSQLSHPDKSYMEESPSPFRDIVF